MPIYTTSRGLDVTAESEDAVVAVEAFEANMLGLTQGLDSAPTDADKLPETPMMQAAAATYFIYGQDEASLAQAEPYLKQAEKLVSPNNQRETQYIRAIRLFHSKRYYEALAVLEQTTEQFSQDLLSAKVTEFLYFCLGQHHSGHRFSAHMKRLEKANSESAGYWSMRSFASELCGDYHCAVEEAEHSLSLQSDQPWAHHTLAHVVSRRGRGQHGIEYMEGLLPVWRKAARGIHSHNAWHLGLLYLDQLDIDKLHTLLKKDIWGITPDAIFEQIDTIALLWRLDIAGQPAPDTLWQDVADKAALHAGQCFIPFIEAHLVYALARCGMKDAVESSIARARATAKKESQDVNAREVWASIGLKLVEASADFGAGKFKSGADKLLPVTNLIPMVGGSDAQDDLFRMALIHGLAHSGQRHDAESLWDRYYGDKWRTAFDGKVLG